MADQEDPADIIRDLLNIAKVAMPDELFALDPRVLRAQDYLAERAGNTSTRVMGLPRISAAGNEPPYKGES